MDDKQRRELIELRNMMQDQQRDLRAELSTTTDEARKKTIQGWLRDLDVNLREIDKDLNRR